MRYDWSLDELVASWTLVGQDWELIGNKTGATRLGFALMLKFFELEAQFPSARSDFAEVVVGFVARQVRVVAGEVVDYEWDGRSASAHRVQIRGAITIYECATCANRALGQQRCDDCHTFMTRIDYGGLCPNCSEPVAINDLLDQEVTRPT